MMLNGSTFAVDDQWVCDIRGAILIPYYYQRFWPDNFEFIAHDDPRAEGGADVVVGDGSLIDDKIVRWPRDKITGQPRSHAYTAFALETWSCTVPGYERKGWMVTNTVDFLLYCFASLDEQTLTCYRIDFPKLQQWFYGRGEYCWPSSCSEQRNRTMVRVVPIADVIANVPVKVHSIGRSKQ